MKTPTGDLNYPPCMICKADPTRYQGEDGHVGQRG